MESATIDAIARHAVDTQSALGLIWALTMGFMAVLMQAGFAFLATGLVRAKNAAHTMAMGLLAYCVAILGYWALGFALQGGVESLAHGQWGAVAVGRFWGSVDSKTFFFNPSVLSGALSAVFVLRAISASVTSTISIGALAERWKLISLLVFTAVVSAVIYPVYANWVWGGGWLASLGKWAGLGHGVVDAGGSAVVHMTGGVAALVAAKLVGPRLGKYTLRGDVRPIPAHNMPMVVFGTLVLAAGWFGLVTGAAWNVDVLSVGMVAVNTMLASTSGGLSAFFHTRVRFGKPDLSMMCNGLLAGLVGISAGGAFVGSTAAVAIGVIASVLAIEGSLFFERKLHIDDPAGAAAVHGLGGAWGLLSVGLFANGRFGDGWNGVAGPVRGLFSGGGAQLAASLIGIVANIIWVAPVAAIVLLVAGRIFGNRVSADDEIAGLDVPELGMTGYVNEAVHATATRSSDLGHGRMSGGSSSTRDSR